MIKMNAILSPTPPLPGIRACVFTDGGCASEGDRLFATGNDQAYIANIKDWFSAWLPRCKNTSTACAKLGDDLAILVEGYVTEIAGRSVLAGEFAKVVLAGYKEMGLDFVKDLRGSFTILICDSAENVAYFISDRRRSRPMFFRRHGNGTVSFSPEVRELLRAGEMPQPGLRVDAVIEFLVFGANSNDRTLFSDVFSIPQATILACSPTGVDRRKYWKIGFHERNDEKGEDELIEECHALIQQAVHRVLMVTREPFLFLSGGVDSRIVLGSLLEQGEMLPVVIYGAEGGDDLSTASNLANKLGLDSIEYRMSSAGLQDYFEAATLDSDCRAETIDSPMASQLHRILGSRFGAFFNGDECFGWHKRGIGDGARLQTSDAIHAIGFRGLKNVGRLSDWLRPSVRSSMEDCMDRIIETLICQAQASNPADLMDTLYYEQRMGNMLNAFTAQNLRFMEQARPFLDEDIIEFVGKLPVRYRYDKRLLRKLLVRRYPDLMEVPLAVKDSIPVAETYRQLFRNDTAMREYVSRNLLEGLDDRLAEILDTERFLPFVKALLDGDRLPAMHMPLWGHVPGLWRFCKVTNDVHPVSLVLRLLQLNIYLSLTR